MPLDSDSILTVADRYADKFLHYTEKDETEFYKLLAQLEKDCKKTPGLADFLIISLTGLENTESRHLEYVYKIQELAQSIVHYGDHGLLNFIGFVFRAKLSTEMLYLYLTEAPSQDQARRRLYAFDVILKELYEPKKCANGFGMGFCCEAGYLFYFEKHELSAMTSSMQEVRERYNLHHVAKRMAVPSVVAQGIFHDSSDMSLTAKSRPSVPTEKYHRQGPRQ